MKTPGVRRVKDDWAKPFRSLFVFGHQTICFFAHQNGPQVMHRQKQSVRDQFQIGILCLGLRPLGRQVQVINRAQDIVDCAPGKQSLAFLHPFCQSLNICFS